MVKAAGGGGRAGGVGAGRGGLRRVLGRAAQSVGPRRARGAADLELDLAAGAALERVGAAGHGAADAGAVQARQVVTGAGTSTSAARGPGGAAAVLGLVAHVAWGAPAVQLPLRGPRPEGTSGAGFRVVPQLVVPVL